jgi:hypothetical protein
MSAIVDQSSNDSIDFDVGGFHFTILKSDIDKHPDSYLATASRSGVMLTNRCTSSVTGSYFATSMRF